MVRYKATNEYAHFGEVYLINGKGYALHWEIDNCAPCGHCALFNNVTTDIEKCVCIPIKTRECVNMNLVHLRDGIHTNMYIFQIETLYKMNN